jgi:peroxiredoxin Q/BCP
VAELKLVAGDRFPIERLSRLPDRRTVVFFYPVAFTGGCTLEVRRYNELVDDFDRSGVDVVGASVDEADVNARFCDAEGLRYELVSDPSKALADELGLVEEIGNHGLRTARVTYLIEPGGTILQIWTVTSYEAIHAHPEEVLATVRQLG